MVRMPSGDRQLRDVGEQVERARRLDAAQARLGRQPARRADRAARRYSSSISVTQSCGPVSAAMTAFCVIEQTFDVEWLCSALQAAITAAGPIAQPQRQPVIA